MVAGELPFFEKACNCIFTFLRYDSCFVCTIPCTDITVYCSCDSWDTCWPAVTGCHHSWGWHNTNIHVLAQATYQRNACKRHVALAAVDASSLGQIFDILSTFQLLQYFLLNCLPRPSLACPCGLRAFGESLWISGTAKPERRTALWHLMAIYHYAIFIL